MKASLRDIGNRVALGFAAPASIAACWTVVWVVAQLAAIMVDVDPHKRLEAASYVASISLPILATIAGYISGFELYNSCMRLMGFWAEVGVLARLNLVDCNVLLDYMAGNIRNADVCFMTFVTRRRYEDGNELYANALWLMEQARALRVRIVTLADEPN